MNGFIHIKKKQMFYDALSVFNSELKLWSKVWPEKNIFYSVISKSWISLEFQAFLTNLENLYSKIKAENQFATFFTGDFNAHSQLGGGQDVWEYGAGQEENGARTFFAHWNNGAKTFFWLPKFLLHFSVYPWTFHIPL